MKICTVVGARPQFVKAAVVSRAFTSFAGRCEEKIIHTGQHYDKNMSDIFFEQMKIPRPHYNLGIGGGSHAEMTGNQMIAIEKVLIEESPDYVMVYGDTNSTLAGALAASKLHIPVAHVEAGLRSFNNRMPEEINRILVDRISSVLFAPTPIARDHLLKEGMPPKKVHLVGDVMCDAAIFYREIARKPDWFDDSRFVPGKFALATLHRAENTDDHDNLRNIVEGLGRSGLDIILPLHPRTADKIKQAGVELPENIHVTNPIGYLEMVWLEMNCALIATDSGGVQKEAFFHKKRCITMREETEWVELVEHGVNILTGADAGKIAEAFRVSLESEEASFPLEIYGGGQASEKVVRTLIN